MKKLSVISRSETGWHVGQIKQAGEDLGLAVELTYVDSINDLKRIRDLGEVVLYRASGLEMKLARPIFLEVAGRNRFVINKMLYENPLVTQKLYQQKIIETIPALEGIKTYQYKTRREWREGVGRGELKYPMIMKANLGARGQKVYKLEMEEDIKQAEGTLKNYIFQNFVKNDGDYRVLVLGGKPLGVMKRMAAKGDFRNNVSLGGSAVQITDREVCSRLYRIALGVTSLFGLQFAGVDIIFDQETEVYRVMEVNTDPQWEGFKGATGVDVGREIVFYAKALMERKEKPTADLVEEYYESNYNYLGSKKVHFISRMYLGLKREVDRQRLDEFRGEYIGSDKTQSRERLREIWEDEARDTDTLGMISKELREPVLRKYQGIRRLNALLFKVVFGQSLYGEDLRELVRELVDDNYIKQMWESLIADDGAIKVLSTLALNFLYNSEFYFKGVGVKVDPRRILDIAKSVGEDGEWLRLKIYLLTHAIIGKSRFYSEKITEDREVYKEMVLLLEEILGRRFFEVSLDNKFEFLVCGSLVGYESKLRGLIDQEAERSLSGLGNYLVDTVNDLKGWLGDQLLLSEHRNVLFILANRIKI